MDYLLIFLVLVLVGICVFLVYKSTCTTCNKGAKRVTWWDNWRPSWSLPQWSTIPGGWRGPGWHRGPRKPEFTLTPCNGGQHCPRGPRF